MEAVVVVHLFVPKSRTGRYINRSLRRYIGDSYKELMEWYVQNGLLPVIKSHWWNYTGLCSMRCSIENRKEIHSSPSNLGSVSGGLLSRTSDLPTR